MKYRSTKTYGTNQGLSCCFRQWGSTHSHCSFLHGYAMGVHFEFGADTLDDKNWVYDFGACKWIKQFLEDLFDHKTIVAADDPKRTYYYDLKNAGLIQLVELPSTGCEFFADYIFEHVELAVLTETRGRVKLLHVKVFEHEGNSASRYAV